MHDSLRFPSSLGLTLVFALGVVGAEPRSPCREASEAFVVIDPPGATFVSPTGINPQGDIVGRYVAAGVSHGFLLCR